MRLVSVKAIDVAPNLHGWLVRQVKAVTPTANVGVILSSIRCSGELFQVETDCESACELLELISSFVACVTDRGVELAISEIERLPQPINASPSNCTTSKIGLSDLKMRLRFEESIRFSGWPNPLSEYVRILEQADWCAHVGEETANLPAATAASQLLPTENWLDVILEAQNRLTETLCFKYPYHYKRSYRRVSESIDLRALVEKKVLGAEATFRSKELLTQSLCLIVHQACLEVYYADLVPVSFGVEWASWLIRGRLPCGWQGSGKDGTLIIA
ncbi:MAG: hypothetical protein ACKOEO_17860 [Planctomycetaceae bacterium]